MDFSIFLPTGFGQEFAGLADPAQAYAALTAVAVAGDERGYRTLFVPDHLTTIPSSHELVFEAWTVLTALATATTRVRLGQLVTSNTYRNPALQAKMASTLDVISGGRLTFGIGAGWYEPDHAGYGFTLGTAKERLRRLDEAVQVIRSLWTEKETTFAGEHYQLDGAVNEPAGLQEPHVPLLIAGGGEQVTLRLVARYADACNVLESPEELARKFAVLRRHCADAGRDYSEIRRTTATLCIVRDTDEEARALVPPGAGFAFPGEVADYGLIGSAATVAERIARYEAAGVQELAISFEDPLSTAQVHDFAEMFLQGSA